MTCTRCKREIGDEWFIPIARESTIKRMANPNFIGRQQVYSSRESSIVSGVCSLCVIPFFTGKPIDSIAQQEPEADKQ